LNDKRYGADDMEVRNGCKDRLYDLPETAQEKAKK